MKTFLLYLKSHCEYPDFEMEVEAENKIEALQKIRKESGHTLNEWEDDMLLENMAETFDHDKKYDPDMDILAHKLGEK